MNEMGLVVIDLVTGDNEQAYQQTEMPNLTAALRSACCSGKKAAF